MPIYEYRCDDCGAEFEKRVARAADSGSVGCPSCGKSHVTMRLSTFAAVTGGSKQPSGMPACPSGACCPNRGMCGMN
ncbi:MAG: zinc ribbon domain-containing protein [Bryobacteraceae bacterium]